MAEEKGSKQQSKDPLQLLKGWQSHQQKRQKNQKRQQFKPGRPSLKQQLPHFSERQKKRTKWRLVFTLVFFAFWGVVASYVIAPVSDIQEISVSGSNKVPDQQIIDASGVRTGHNVVWTLFHQKQIKQRIKHRLPKIKTVHIKQQGLNHLMLQVSEYPTVGYWVKHENYYPILSNGTILTTKMTQSLGNSPVYSHFKEDKYLKAALTLYQKFPNSVQSAISEIKLTAKNRNPYQVHLYMNDGNEVIGDLRTLDKKIKYYPVLAKQLKKKGTIDLEVGAYSKAS